MFASRAAEIWRWMLGEPAANAGQGLEVTLVHSWPWPPWVTVVFLMAAGLYILAIYWREPGDTSRSVRLALAAVRLTLVALLLTMMYGWTRNRFRTDLPDLIIAIDDSESMSLGDGLAAASRAEQWRQRLARLALDEPTRINMARLLLLEDDGRWLRRLSAHYNLKLYLISTSARVQRGGPPQWQQQLGELEAARPESRLGRAVVDILDGQRGRPTVALVLLTDGITTEGQSIGEVADQARRKGVPLYVVGLGDQRPPRDVRVTNLLVEDAVFLGDLVHFDFTLTATGIPAQALQVRLTRQGSDTVLAEETVRIAGDGQPQRARLSYRASETGSFQFVVEVESLDDEVNTENNRQTRTVEVRDETIRVLYVQEYPGLEFRYLKTLLQRSVKRAGQGKAIQLTTVLQEADVDYVAQDDTAQHTFPVDRGELFSYDVVIFGDVNPSLLSRRIMENLVAFVGQRGGGLVISAGPRHTPVAYRDTPLESLFPVKLDTVSLPSQEELMTEGFRVQPTRLIATSPQMQLADSLAESARIWSRLPPIRWLLACPDTRPAARVLAEHPSRTGNSGQRLPVILVEFIGAGKVQFHATDETWRWARAEGSDAYYERFWIQTLRYLSRSKLLAGDRSVEIVLDRNRYEQGQTVPLRVRFFDDRLAPAADDGVVVLVEREGGRRRRVRLRRDANRRGVFQGAVGNLPEGDYRAYLAVPTLEGRPPSRRFVVEPPPGERARLAMDAEDLSRAARESRGKFYTLASAHELIDELPRGRQVRVESLPAAPLWNSAWLVVPFVLLLTFEWLVRRRVGWL